MIHFHPFEGPRTGKAIIYLCTVFLACAIARSAFAQPSPPPVESASAPLTLKIMTVNIRHDSDWWEERFPLIADEIVRVRPDIIGLQEVEIGANQSSVLLGLIAERAKDDPLQYEVYERLKTGFHFFEGEGIAVFSRFPIVKKGFRDLENGRPLLLARVRLDDGTFADFYDAHLHHQGGDAVRLAQARRVTDYMKKRDDGPPVFFVGDMNATPDSGTMANFKDWGLRDAWLETHGNVEGEEGFTSPIRLEKNGGEQAPARRIDYILFKPGKSTVRPVEAEVVFRNRDQEGLYPSDHLGVVATFQIQKP